MEEQGVCVEYGKHCTGFIPLLHLADDMGQVRAKGIGQAAQRLQRKRFNLLRARRKARRLTGLRHDCHISAKRRQGIET